MSETGCCYTARRKRGVMKEVEIHSESGGLAYLARYKRTLRGRTIAVLDRDGNEIAAVRQSLALILPKYRVCINGDGQTFTVQRAFSIQPRYVLDGSLYWSVEGDLGSMAFYALDRENQRLFRMDRSLSVWSEQFALCVAEPGIHMEAICTALAIDAAEDDLRRARKK